ncbi:outer membrane protein [Rhodoblastus acidophilus]|uniref:OmpW/AlkL family protein n=1 Tax=Rhodoblastus acidophilus TaxID=1074 RepID=UPI002225357F|nr:OmpW family outer membrane protein [Rhodoblastus acidophilus]MCW2314611.1 outer membrane protein [Rhodoblastus acidophilus]
MISKLLAKALATTALVCAATAAAQAADLPSVKAPLALPPVAEAYQPYFMKLGFAYAINQSHSKMYANGLDAGVSATVEDVATLGFEAGWFITKNISINVSGGIPLPAKDKVKGTSPNPAIARYAPNGTSLTEALPAIIPITVAWHFDNFGPVQPYVGIGAGPGFSFSNKDAYLTNVKLSGALNTVITFGLDYMVNEHWGVSLDVKKAFAYLDGHGTVKSGPLKGSQVVQHLHFEPWILSTGIVYRFGGPDAGPVLAKY